MKFLSVSSYSSLFHRGLYAFTLWSIFELAGFYSPLPSEILFSSSRIPWLSHILFYPTTPKLYTVMIYTSGIISLAGLLLYKRTFITDLLLWIIYLNLIHFHYETIHGGNYALCLFLFNCAFLPDGVFIRKDTRKTVWLFCRIQWVIIYMFSAFFKWKEELWIGGKAIGIILQSPWFNSFPLNFPPLLAEILNYLVLFFQTFFPLIFFFRFLRTPFVLLGLSIHLCIALCMNLLFFGCFMMWLFWLIKDLRE